MQVRKLLLDHKGVGSAVLRTVEMERSRSRHGDVAFADANARQAAHMGEHGLLQRHGRVLIELRMRICFRRLRFWAAATADGKPKSVLVAWHRFFVTCGGYVALRR